MGRAPCCDKANVKKGPWSPEEDTKLKDFIEKSGTCGNWIALPQKAGLKRCGKSCRLRWLNYLRPNIKHGEFSDEEDRIICTLYASIGSRWSVIAAQLPGRTDNDIKNYWNTKLKKKLIMGIVPSKSSTFSGTLQDVIPQSQSLRNLSHLLDYTSVYSTQVFKSLGNTVSIPAPQNNYNTDVPLPCTSQYSFDTNQQSQGGFVDFQCSSSVGNYIMISNAKDHFQQQMGCLQHPGFISNAGLGEGQIPNFMLAQYDQDQIIGALIRDQKGSEILEKSEVYNDLEEVKPVTSSNFLLNDEIHGRDGMYYY